MTLNKKISLITIAVVFTSLLVSSVVNIINFRASYTQALLTGSFGLAQTLNGVVSELLNLGLPLESLDGMDKKLHQVVEQNQHIKYAAIVDLNGQALFHSDPALIGARRTDKTMQRSIASTQPIYQLYPRTDGYEYYDVTVPIFDAANRHIGVIRLGFPTEVINAKVWEAIVQVVINFVAAFLIIAILLNRLLSRFVSRPVMALSRYARQITDGCYDATAPVDGNDEVGALSLSLRQLAATIASQIAALQHSHDELEKLVLVRTEELAVANAELQGNNATLEATVRRLQASEQALRESETQFRGLFESSSDAVLLFDEQGFFDCNQAALTTFQCQSRQDILGRHPHELSPPVQPDGATSALSTQTLIDKALTDGAQLFEWTHRRLLSGEDFAAEVMLSPVTTALGRKALQAVVRDISARKQAEQRETQRRDVMERLIRGERLATILESIALSVEQERPGAFCSIHLLDDSGKHLLSGAAPSLPAFFNVAAQGLEIGDGMGSCGTAAFLRQRVIVEDIQQHPYWEAYKNLAEQARLGACWSEPILGSHQKLLGTFAIYHHQPATPTLADLELIQHASRLCAIAIERSKTETQQQLAASVFANSYEGIMITDANNLIVDVNPAFSRITGFERDEILGLSPKVLQSGRHDRETYARIWHSLQNNGYWRGEIWNRRKSGELYAEMLAIAAVRDETGQVRNYVAVFSDISRIKAHEEELDRIAHYDPLTGLPNRRLLSDRLIQGLAHAQRHGKLMAVCYLDLDGFKPVNDSYGHDAGDQLLIEISNRLKATLRSDDTLARLGGDEFVLLLCDLSDPQECSHALDRVLSALTVPVEVSGVMVTVSASIGVALYPLDDVDGDTLLRHADHAMYRAKQNGKNRYHLFDPQHDRELKDRRDHLQNLLQALHAGEFLFFYQPKVNLLSGELIGAEALIRWQHPQQGLLTPAAFLDSFAGSNLEIELGEWVIATALQQIASWQQQGLNLQVSVNISANHLLSAHFVERLERLLARYPSVAPGYLELEVLETAAMDDMSHAIEVMAQCKALGVHFALDDFGTGYSSLAYFRRLPVDMLKIDQGFVRDMLDDREDFTIVESVVRLAQAFNRPVIAEGVETLDHAARLIQLGCTLGQGYGIARPMPADKLLVWLTDWRDRAAWERFELPAVPVEDLPLVVAAQSHKVWIGELLAHIQQPEHHAVPVLSSERCAFGHWCHGSGRRHYGSWSEFQAIDPLHERIHQIAGELVELTASGQFDVAQGLQAELLALRDQLLSQITVLTEKVAAQRSSGHGVGMAALND